MDTKNTLERTCQHMEDKYSVPEDFKRRIREILQPLFVHELSADEMLVIEKALERTYVRHAQPAPEPPPCPDPGHPVPGSDGSLEAEVATRGAQAGPKGAKGGLLLVRIDPKTKTARLIRMTPSEVKKALENKVAFAEFLKDASDEDDTIVH